MSGLDEAKLATRQAPYVGLLLAFCLFGAAPVSSASKELAWKLDVSSVDLRNFLLIYGMRRSTGHNRVHYE